MGVAKNFLPSLKAINPTFGSIKDRLAHFFK